MALCIIPARGGSKRIPRKNIRDFCGKPMIAWSIEAAHESGCFERIVVSTDDEEIARVAVAYGAEVPFMRSPALADDMATVISVMRDVAVRLADVRDRDAVLCLLYATAPLVRARDLIRGGSLLGNAGYALAVTPYPFPIQRAFRITQDERLEMLSPEHLSTRSQDLEEAWHDAGQFCFGTSAAWQRGGTIFGLDTVPVKLPAYRVVDIDTPEDWVRAEAIFRALSSGSTQPLE